MHGLMKILENIENVGFARQVKLLLIILLIVSKQKKTLFFLSWRGDDMMHITEIGRYMTDCPVAWQNFVNSVLEGVEVDAASCDPIPFSDDWNPINEVLINKGLVKFNGHYHAPKLIFDNETDAIHFKLVWG